jgi:hypothetical protein
VRRTFNDINNHIVLARKRRAPASRSGRTQTHTINVVASDATHAVRKTASERHAYQQCKHISRKTGREHDAARTKQLPTSLPHRARRHPLHLV